MMNRLERAMSSAIDDNTIHSSPGAVEPAVESADACLVELQKASNYLLRSDTMRHGGIWGIVWGIVAIAVGFSSTDASPLNAVLGVLGIFLVLEGLWVVISPTPAGLIADGIAIGAVGLWNIVIGIQNPSVFLGIGGWQIYLSCRTFGRYKSFSAIYKNKPAKDVLASVNRTSKTIDQMRWQRVPDLIEFKVGGKVWKGRLLRDSAVLVQPSGYVEYLERGQLQIQSPDGCPPRKPFTAKFNVANRSFNGTISPESFERYDAWSAGKEISSEAAGEAIEASRKEAQSIAVHNRGVARKASGDAEGALRDYDEAIRLNPRLAIAFSNRGNTRFEKGDMQGALTDYDEAIRLDSRNADVYYNRALVYEYRCEFAKAIADLKKYLDLRSGIRAGDTQAVRDFIAELQQRL